MSKEDIPVITDREELYDKCENMEQLFDKYYLPLLDKHYSKTYELQQENKKLREKYKATNKGLIKVLSKRLKWKRRYYKEKYIRKELKKWLEEAKTVPMAGSPIKYYYGQVLLKIKELEEGVK